MLEKVCISMTCEFRGTGKNDCYLWHRPSDALHRQTISPEETGERCHYYHPRSSRESGFITPMGLAAIGLGILMVSNIIFYNLWRSKVDELANYRAAVVAAQKQAEQDAEHQRAEQGRIVGDVSASWAAALDHARKHPLVRVLQPGCDLPQAGPIPPAAGGNAGVSPGGGQGWITTAQCEQIANDSLLDREWINAAKRLTDELHEASK